MGRAIPLRLQNLQAKIRCAGIFLSSVGVLALAGLGDAHALGEGTKGWCTVLGAGNGACFSSPMAACSAQHAHYVPKQAFYGYVDTDRWWTKLCQWQVGIGIPGPGSVDFDCEFGYTRQPGGCVLTNDNFQQRVEAPQDACPADARNGSQGISVGAASLNGGGMVSPSTGGPISILSGAKLFTIEDFRAKGGGLELIRVYNSKPFGRAYTLRKMPLGLSQLWRFSFQHELHLYPEWGSGQFVELQSADGMSFLFRRGSTGNMAPSANGSATPQTDYTLEFVGTWPSPLSQVLATQTQWRVRDPDGRNWLYQTFLDPQTNQYSIARPISVTFLGGLEWTFQYGGDGELSSVTDGFGKTISFEWIVADPGTVGSSDAPYPVAISAAELPDGTKIHYSYETLDDTVTTLPQADRLVEVRHADALDNTIKETTYLHEDEDLPWHVTGILDTEGTRRWTVDYDDRGRAIQSEGPSGADAQTIAYGTIGSGSASIYTRTVTNALGKAATYRFVHGTSYGGFNVRFDRVDGIASTNCPASVRSVTYSSSNELIATSTDEEGRVTQYVRNAATGLPTSITRGYGTAQAKTTGYTWHSTLRTPTQIVEEGLTTDLTWNSNGQLTVLTQTDTTTHSVPYPTNGQSRTWLFTYESTGGLLETINGPLSGTGDTVTYDYNTDGYLQSVTNEVGHVTQFTAWDGRGQPTAMTDPNGVNSTFAYDDLGRLTEIVVDPSTTAATTTLEYNVVGDITKITRPSGAFLEFTWNNARRLTHVEDNTGAVIEYDHDGLGNVTAQRIKDASSTLVLTETSTFDELGRLLTHVGAASQTWTFAHDKTDNLVSITDPRSNVYQYGFDALNRLVKETNEANAEIDLTRNGKDEVIEYSDFRSLETGYVRNGFGDAIQRTSPDTGTTIFEYSAAGKATKITDARGIVVNLAYDNAGRLLSKDYPAASAEDIAYTWDSVAGGNHGKGRITKVEDQSGSVERFYDALGRKTQEKKTTGSAVYTIDYAYDADGRVAGITYPSGRIVTFSRNAVGEITGVTTKKDSSSPVVTLASNVYFMPHGGPLQSLDFGNGLTLWKTFADNYRLDLMMVQDASVPQDIIVRWHSYSDNLNLTEIADGLNSSRTESYWYWPTGWLQEATGPWGELAYSYTDNGDRTWEVLTQGSTVTERALWYPSTSNLPTDATEDSVQTRVFTHDAAGNLIEDDRAGTVYEYRHNNRGRLDRISVNSQVRADYTYDALERLAVRTTQNMTPSGTTHYVYDLEGRLLAEASATGNTVREYIWLDDLPLAVVADVDTIAPKLYFVHADHLNRPIKMTDGAKTSVWDAVYLPFGEAYSITGSAANNLRFPGQYFQLEAGLHYNWHRHYDPTMGRYLQPDPLANTEHQAGQAQFGLSPARTLAGFTPTGSAYGRELRAGLPGFVDGPSLYAYARSQPMILIDPDGRAALAPAMAVGTAAGRAGAAFCAQYPALCGAIAAGVNACFRAVTGSGGGGNDNNDCKEEIRKAREICTRAYANGWRSDSDVGPYKKPAGGQWTIQDCMRGLISQRCGGNSVN